MNKKNALIMALALVLVTAISVGGTIAWLTAKTGEVVNTFTVGNINIDLEEHDYDPSTGELLKDTVAEDGKNEDYKVIPGVNLPKDPWVTVEANSEACWLFVKVVPTNWPTGSAASKITYSVKTNGTIGDDGTYWKKLENVDNVWYCEVPASTTEQTFSVLADDTVYVSNTLTKSEVDDITTPFTLTITAYAVQKTGITNVADAWTQASSAADGYYDANGANTNNAYIPTTSN